MYQKNEEVPEREEAVLSAIRIQSAEKLAGSGSAQSNPRGRFAQYSRSIPSAHSWKVVLSPALLLHLSVSKMLKIFLHLYYI